MCRAGGLTGNPMETPVHSSGNGAEGECIAGGDVIEDGLRKAAAEDVPRADEEDGLVHTERRKARTASMVTPAWNWTARRTCATQ